MKIIRVLLSGFDTILAITMHAQQPEIIIKNNELRLDLIGPALANEH